MLSKITRNLIPRLRPLTRVNERCLSDNENHSEIKDHTYDIQDRGDYCPVNMQNLFHVNEDYMIVDRFSQFGFVITPGIKVLGPVALFPRTALHWNIKSAEQVDQHSLVLFHLLIPKLDLLVIGKGTETDQVNPAVHTFMKAKGVNTEILPTEQACALFNMLSSEGRNVAAGLIPPSVIPIITGKLRS